MVWVVTWLSVVVLNVDLGLAIGVVFSMMTVICRTQRYIKIPSHIYKGALRLVTC